MLLYKEADEDEVQKTLSHCGAPSKGKKMCSNEVVMQTFELRLTNISTKTNKA